ncbi:MAG: DEAD/DEAH box helicase family protein [Candidatus Methanoperedens sp.]
MKSTIDKLIVNSPYEEPAHFWSYERETRFFTLKDGRRPAGYVVASESSKAFDDPGIFKEIPLANKFRPRIKTWREAGYSGVTGITKRLLEHWRDPEEREHRRFFFCQLEAIETLIWLAEAPEAEKVGIEIPSDGGLFKRLCLKMATGTGKTIVMAMLIAWQVLNKVTYPQDTRFSKNFFIVAPGLTVKNRLEVLQPSALGNYYDEFNIVPPGLSEKLNQGKVLIQNWHALNWETEEKIAKKKGVDKRGAKSDEAYVREVLGELANAHDINIINDEAHHAWRIPAESKVKGLKKEDIEEATKWVGGLDRIDKTRGILTCYDFSATPFVPSGKKSSDEALFPWIISDFGLNDAIESGLVKTPRVVVRDDGVPDAKTYRSKLYHIYEHVKDDLNRNAQAYEPLPDLVTNGYYLLGKDWLETAKLWKEKGFKTPPVMISVANRTETAARVKHAFDHKNIHIDELCIPERILHIDSEVLKIAESQEETTDIENTESIVPVFDSERPIRSTGDMRTWYTGKPCESTKRSHINFCVFDSTWEASEAFELDRNPNIDAWVKNDHLGFEILYIFKGEVRKYRPDFLIRLKNRKLLILETKGQDSQQDKTKREFLDEWVKAVNQQGGFGEWTWAVSKDPADVSGIIQGSEKNL